MLFEGTFETLAAMVETPRQSPASVRSTNSSTSIMGKPLNLDELDKKYPDKGKDDYYYYTESDEAEESDEEFVTTFTFAKNIANPKEVLTGPPSSNSKPPDYLRIIGNDTDTECSLEGRSVKIVGTCEETIKEAADRFKNLQTMYKRRKRTTTVVPCVHYPVESPPVGLYLCDLQRYAHRLYVANTLNEPAYVMLPVFKDKTGNYQKPKDLLDTAPVITTTTQWVAQQQQQQLSLDERMQLATLEHNRGFGNQNAGLAPDLTPLWGENKNYVVRKNSPKSPPPGRMAPPPPKNPADDFPSLPTAPRPTVTKKQTTTRRVVRLVNQKASPKVASPARSNLDIVREYNLHNIRTALQDGLTGVQSFKGGIKISAKLGKVLWTKVSKETQKRIWDIQEVKDILMDGHQVKPVFNNMTTLDSNVMEKIAEILPEPYGKTAYYEIYAAVRNQPMVPYQSVTMHMNQGVVELKKAVTKTNVITEVDWVSLDRKYDWQMSLKTEEYTRVDVKPYNTFIKKVAVDPITRIITFENVPDFLDVDYILLKQTTKYRIHFPFVVEITRVERLPLTQQKFNGFSIEKFQGVPGQGQVWYDLEIFYTTFDEYFKLNHNLPVGKMASWKVEDVIGDNEQSALVEYIRCLLLLVEKCDGSL